MGFDEICLFSFPSGPLKHVLSKSVAAPRNVPHISAHFRGLQLLRLPFGFAPVRHALRMLVRDMTKVFGSEPLTTEDPESAGIRIQYADQ